MARIARAEPRKLHLLAGLYVRFVYWVSKRKLGRVVMPLQVAAHHARLFFGYTMMEQSFLSSRLIPASLKNLAQLQAATLIGCPF